MKTSSNITLHMVASIDGFIAKKDGDISWMHTTDHYEAGKVLTHEDINAYLQKIDCYVMGSKTYEQAIELGWVYGEKPVVVLTNRSLISERPTVHFYSGDQQSLMNDLEKKHQNIWLVGGAATAKDFLQQDLVNEIVLTLMPVILGDGLLFFDFVGVEKKLHLKDITAYQDGMVEITYDVKKT